MLSNSGFEEFSFSTQDYSPTGVYTVNLYLLKQYSNKVEREFLTSETIKVEEFLPDTLITRTPESSVLNVKPGKENLYASCLTEFLDMWRKLARMRGLSALVLVIDIVASLSAVRKLNLRLKQLDEISKVMLLSAEKIGGTLSQKTLEGKEIYDNAIEKADTKTQEIKEKIAEKTDATTQSFREKYEQLKSTKDGESRFAEIKAKYGKIVDAADFKLSEWREKYDRLMDARDRSVERLIKAFPQLRSTSYGDTMESLKRRLKVISAKVKIESSFKSNPEEAVAISVEENKQNVEISVAETVETK